MASFKMLMMVKIIIFSCVVSISLSLTVLKPKMCKMRYFNRDSLFMSSERDNSIDRIMLGGSDLHVSRICLGTMTWGQQNSVSEGIEQLNCAFNEYGINFLDTAEMYPIPTKVDTQGRTDRIISKWLKEVDRSKVVLATKIAGHSNFITWLPGREGGGSRVNRQQMIISVDESLKRLGTDYIDLLQIHWPDRYVPLFGQSSYDVNAQREYTSFEEQLQVLDELKKAGKIRHYGVSNETPFGVMKFSQVADKLGVNKMVSIQNSYSLLVRSDYENGLLEVCTPTNENVGLLAYSPLAGGILTGKYAKADCPSTARLNLFDNYMSRYKQSLAQLAVKEYCEVADKNNLTPTELALIWCYNQKHVASTIIGATSLTQLKENIDSYFKSHLLTSDIINDINNIYKKYRDPARI